MANERSNGMSKDKIIKYDFKKVVLKDIEGNRLEHNMHETIGNGLYRWGNEDLGILDLAHAIHRGEPVMLTSSQFNEVKRIVKDERVGFFTFSREAINSYMDEVRAKIGKRENNGA